MAGLLAGDPLHHGMVETGPYNLSQENPEEAGCWYLSRKEIEENSPSRRDGIDLKKEAYLRKSYCTFLQDLGMRLKVPQVTIATAIMFCHRLFLRQSHAKNDRRTIATVCMFLAGKVEETPRPLKDVILVSYEIINKKDPAAIQRMKQKEVYEQQKEMILLGERVVLATLGFDFNVHHPYKPLVEAIKKFKVAQNALAQVAWNFVNDGLRTSLCLQFKPHHIAAGAIFLAAKFLKVKLPSDGEKVWWQEFDVTPRQLEEVSNQMLELYEQNRVPEKQSSEMEGSAGGGTSQRPIAKAPSAAEGSGPANGYDKAGVTSSVMPGAALPPSTRLSDQAYVDVDGGAQRSSQNRLDDYGATENKGSISDHKVDDEAKVHQDHEHESLPYDRENVRETSNVSRVGVDEHANESKERKYGRSETLEGGTPCNSSKGGHNLEHKEVPVSQSPHDAIKMIDKDKVKARLEKHRKSRGDIARKLDLVDDDDLIERELEDGIELAAESGKIKQDRRQSWTKLSNKQELGKPEYGKDGEGYGGRDHSGKGRQLAPGPEGEIVEEGEMSLSDDADPGIRSPNPSNRKRKAGSPDIRHSEGKQRNDYSSAYHQSHHDITQDGNRISRRSYAEG